MTGPDALVPLAFDGQSVDIIIDEDGAPWFRAQDVGACLEMAASTVRSACGKLPPRHVKPSDEIFVADGKASRAPFGSPPSYLSKPGLFRFILTSNMPKADALVEWVTEEVLPQIDVGTKKGEAWLLANAPERCRRPNGREKQSGQLVIGP